MTRIVRRPGSRLSRFLGVRRDGCSRESEPPPAQLIVEKASEAVFWVDADAKFHYVNEATCRSLGYTREELLTLSVPDISAKRTLEGFRLLWQAVKEQGPRTYESVHRRKDGREFPVEITTSYVRIGGEEYLLALARDISERKQSEEALQRRDHQLEILLRTTRMINAVLDTPTILRSLVASAMELTGATAGACGLLVDGEMVFTEYNEHGKLFAIDYTFEPGYGVPGHVLCSKEPYISNDTEHDAHVVPEIRKTLGFYNLIDVPILGRDGELLGCFEIHNTEDHRPFDESDTDLLGSLAAGAAIALENARGLAERRRGEEDLRESEAKYKNLVETTETGYLILNLEGRVVDANAEYVRLTGYSSLDEIQGRPVTDWTAPYDLERNAEEVRECAERGFVRNLEIDYISPTGKITPIEVNATVIATSEGPRILTLCRDITTRRHSEETLRLQAQILEQVHDSVIATDMDGYVTSWNMGAGRLYGYTAEEALGRHVDFIYPERDREKLRTDIIGVLKEKESHEAEVTVRRKSGDEFQAQVLLSLLRDKAGGLIGMIGYSIDITERRKALTALRESEARYRRLFEHNPDIVFLVKEGVFTAVSPAVTRVLGYEPKEVVGCSPWEISPEIQPDGVPSKAKAMLILANLPASGSIVFEWAHKHKGGALVDCEVSLVAYEDQGREYVQAIVRDITERKRSEENKRSLERSMESQKRQFYRETIRSVTDGKLEICDDPEIRPYVRREQLLLEIHTAREASDARHQAEAFCREHQLEGDRLESFILGVGEAITNAVKHGREGLIYAGATEESVWISIADKGEGIASLILPRAVLLRGFSTKPSLGLGYSIMLNVADHILLKTGERGTTVVLVKHLREPKPDLFALELPDTWDSVPS